MSVRWVGGASVVCRGVVAAFGLALLAACGGDDAGAGMAGYSVRDSAGVEVHTTPASEAFAPLGWTVDPIPELVLGEENSPGGYFGSIEGVRTLDEGRLLVLDGLQHDLRLFDGTGRILARFGGTGQGPDEFLGPSLVSTAERDSVIIFDRFNLRLTVLSTDLGESRTMPVPDWQYGRVAPLGAVGTVLLRARALFNGTPLDAAMTSEGPVRELRTWFWYDPAHDTEADFAAIEAVRWVTHPAIDPANRIPGFFTLSRVPLAPTAIAVPHGAGAFLASGTDYDVRDYGVEGGVRRIFRVEAQPRPTTTEAVEQDEWYDAEVKAYTDPLVPQLLPTFTGLLVDSEGWLWVRLYDSEPDVHDKWVVFDRHGRAQGTVETPAGLDVRAIEVDRIVGVGTGELGEEFVRVHQLRRSAAVDPGVASR